MPVYRVAGRLRLRALTGELDAWKLASRVAPEPQPKPRWRLRLLVAAAALALGVALLSARRPQPRPFALRNDSTGFTVFDQSGTALWNKVFPVTLVSTGCFGFPGGRVFDLDGDGINEILFIPSPEVSSADPIPLVCYNADGTERWRFVPGRKFNSRRDLDSAGFAACSFIPLPSGAGAKIALGSLHRLYYPYQVAFLDAGGRLLREYWHPGHLQAMALYDVDADGKLELLLAGVNNARKQATLVALDPSQAAGAARETSPDYTFSEIPAATEIARLFFPVSTLTGIGRYNRASSIDTTADRITVHVMEQLLPERATVFYEFGPGLKPLGFSVGDDFAALLRTESPQTSLAEEERRLQAVERQ